jgi:hypothetical protein
MIYEVKKITRLSLHPASKYIEDEQMTIVEAESGEWWKADEFFNIMSISRFETDGEEWHK